MLLPLSQVPAKYLQPLFVNPGEEYTLDVEKFPGLNDREHIEEPALIVANVAKSTIIDELLENTGHCEDYSMCSLNAQTTSPPNCRDLDRNHLPSWRYESMPGNHVSGVHQRRERGDLFALLSCLDDDDAVQNTTMASPEATTFHQPEPVMTSSFLNQTTYLQGGSVNDASSAPVSKPPSKRRNYHANGIFGSCQPCYNNIDSVLGFSPSPLREPQVTDGNHSDFTITQIYPRKRKLPEDIRELAKDEYSCPVMKRPRSEATNGSSPKRHTIHYYGQKSGTRLSAANNTYAINTVNHSSETGWDPQMNIGGPHFSVNFDAMFSQSPMHPRLARQS